VKLSSRGAIETAGRRKVRLDLTLKEIEGVIYFPFAHDVEEKLTCISIE
jgi:hypothetical protein